MRLDMHNQGLEISDLSAKSVPGTMSLLLLLVLSVLAVNTGIVKATGTGYTQPPGLVGYWNFDQGSGTIAYDNSGNNNQGTIYGALWTTGRINGALNFDGLNDYVDCGNSETLDPTQGATIEAWVNFNQLPSDAKHIMAIAGRSGGGTDLDIQTETDNKFKFYVGPGAPSVAVSNTVVETNEWYHIAGTYQANEFIKIYVNGVLEKTTSIGITRNTNPNKLQIGQSLWPGRFFNGTIDEVKIFNRALSAEEIGAEYMYVSVSSSSDVMDVGQSQLFNSSVMGGASPCTYQWYLSDNQVSGATSSSWTFTPSSPGAYTVYVNATDNVGTRAKSNIATVTVNPSTSPSTIPSPTLSPAFEASLSESASALNYGNTVNFTVSANGGIEPYTYVWYVDNQSAQSGDSPYYSTNSQAVGSHHVYVQVTDAASNSAQTLTVEFNVLPVSSLSPSPSSIGQPTLQPSPTADNTQTGDLTPIIILSGIIVIAAVVAVLVYFRKRKRS